MFYFILQSYSTRSPEFTGLKVEEKKLFICFFFAGSGSGKIIPDPEKVSDPFGSGFTTRKKPRCRGGGVEFKDPTESGTKISVSD